MKQYTLIPNIFFLISALAMSLVAPAHLSLFSYSYQDFVLVSDPDFNFSLSDPPSVDLDNDGVSDTIVLHQGTFEIRSRGVPVWTSPPNWQVVQARITDLNHDHHPEVTLLIWRAFAPWPIDSYLPHPGRIQDFHNRHNRSCHLILIGWRRGVFGEIWAGSALADPILDFTIGDLDHDGNQELIALERPYDTPPWTYSTIKLWEWNGFGFTLQSHGPKGRFNNIYIIQTSDGQDLLLVQGTHRR